MCEFLSLTVSLNKPTRSKSNAERFIKRNFRFVTQYRKSILNFDCLYLSGNGNAKSSRVTRQETHPCKIMTQKSILRKLIFPSTKEGRKKEGRTARSSILGRITTRRGRAQRRNRDTNLQQEKAYHTKNKSIGNKISFVKK